MDDAKQTWQANFFEAVPHPYLKPDTFKHYAPAQVADNPIPMYRLKQSDDNFKSYWDRRENADWEGLPNLWGEHEHLGRQNN